MTEQEKLTPLDVLRRDGWCQGEVLDVDGRVCIIGASRCLGAGPIRDAFHTAVEDVAQEQFPERCNIPAFSVADFNDHTDTTFTDVELVVEKAQIRLAERVL